MKCLKSLFSVVGILFVYSCQNLAADKTIIGVWIPVNNTFGTKEQIIFTKDGEMLIQSAIDNNIGTERVVKFKMSNSGKVLIVDDGEKKEQLEIIELNKSTLKL